MPGWWVGGEEECLHGVSESLAVLGEGENMANDGLKKSQWSAGVRGSTPISRLQRPQTHTTVKGCDKEAGVCVWGGRGASGGGGETTDRRKKTETEIRDWVRSETEIRDQDWVRSETAKRHLSPVRHQQAEYCSRGFIEVQSGGYQ